MREEAVRRRDEIRKIDMTPNASEMPFRSLNDILALAGQALEVADQAEEHLLGAKLSEVLFFTRARLTEIEQRG